MFRSLRSEASVECKKPSKATACTATQQVNWKWCMVHCTICALPFSRSTAFYFWIRHFYLFRFASSTSLKIRVSLTTWFLTILTLCGWAFICCSLKGKHIVADILSLTQMLESTLRLFNATAVPPGNKPIDPRADPKWKKNFLEIVGECMIAGSGTTPGQTGVTWWREAALVLR